MPGQVAADAIRAHMATYLGPTHRTFPDIAGGDAPISVHLVSPTRHRPTYELYTTGMSHRAMPVPPGSEPLARAELMVSLPTSWPMTPEALEDEAWSWPLRWLRAIARMPFSGESWLSVGHQIPNGDPPRPFAAGTNLCGWVVLRALSLPPGAETVHVVDDLSIQLYSLLPLHAAEMDLQLREGLDALMRALIEGGVDPRVYPDRPAVV